MKADGTGNDTDANWLVIGGRISSGHTSWYFEHPCLLTAEAEDLASWLRHVATGGERSASPWTIETNIRLDLIRHDASAVTLQVVFRQESAPPGSSDDVRFDSGFPVEVTLSTADLAAAADDWVKELSRFPKR